MPIDSKFYKQKKAKSFYYAIAFLVFVILLTGGLYGYNTTVVNENNELDTNISVLKTSIEKLKDDDNIKAYSLYTGNKKTFDTLTAQSQIPDFVKHIKLSSRLFELSGFNYSDGTLTMKFISESDTSSQAYEKIVTFLKAYRENESNIFELEDISGVNGQDKLTFTATFILKK